MFAAQYSFSTARHGAIVAILALALGGAGCDGADGADGAGQAAPVPAACDRIAVHELHEIRAVNGRRYSNPFDYAEIELRAHYTAPSGRTIDFHGFYDGDGAGGQSGDVWKVRIAPDESGRWEWRSRWSDGTPGASGCVDVVAGDAPGPLRVFAGDPRYFAFADGGARLLRGYYLSEAFATDDASRWLDQGVARYFGGRYGYDLAVTVFWQNRLLVDNDWSAWGPDHVYNGFYPVLRRRTLVDRLTGDETVDYTTYDLRSWTHLDRVLGEWHRRRVVWLNFDGIFPNVGGRLHRQPEAVQRNFVQYYVARLFPYPYALHNIAFEYDEFLDDERATEIAGWIDAWDPFDRPLSIHGLATPPDFPWADFTLVQIGAGTAGSAGEAFDRVLADYAERDKPVVCLECSWEGEQDDKLDERGVRRGAWGQALGGSVFVYAEQFAENGTRLYGDGGAFPYIEILYDVLAPLDLATMRPRPRRPGQPAVVLADPETVWLAYVDAGSALDLDLSGVAGRFTAEWIDPRSGDRLPADDVEGGGPRRFDLPGKGDWALLLRRANRGG